MRAKRKDANQDEIEQALLRMGWSVEDTSALGNGFPDMVAAKRGHTVAIEVKDGAKPPSARKLTGLEAAFRQRWRGLYKILTSVNDAVEMNDELSEFASGRRGMMVPVIAALSVLLTAATCRGAAITGKVVRVSDGDTVDVVTRAGETNRIRLAHIDAPEKRQLGGCLARAALKKLVGGKRVVVTYEKRGRWGRIVGEIEHGTMNANLYMVRQGWAWWYRQFSTNTFYGDAERLAQDERVGIWRGAEPPWEWRRR